MKPGAILDPSTLPDDFSLGNLIKQSLYADNVIICSDDRSGIMKDAIATVLTLNSYSFKVHEVFSNVIPEMLLVEKLVQDYGGHIELHSEIKRILKDLEDSEDTEAVADAEVKNNLSVSKHFTKYDGDHGGLRQSVAYCFN